MQTALTLTSMLMATASASPAMAAASSTATPTMGQPLALQDAPSFAGTVIDEILSATARDATPFYWVNGNKCANFELNSGDIPYVKKNCRIYQEGTCASQGYTVADGSRQGATLGVFPCYLGAISRTLTVNSYEKASFLDEILAEDVDNNKDIVALAAGDADLSTLVAAVKDAGLVSALEGKGPFTVFAPTNEAFAKLPAATLKELLQPQNVGKLKAILTYHVVAGSVHAKDLRNGEMVTTLEGQKLRVTINRGGVFIDGAKVTTADVDASNGVVHVIDSVLLPPKKAASLEDFMAPEKKDIVALAAGDADLSTLVAAVKDAGLVSALEGKGPFTVFAPTNEAFAKLPAATLKELLQPQNVGKLKAILTYHVVAGSVHAKDLRNGEMVTTLEGQKLRVTINRGGVFIDGAKVTTADVDASNGVVHVIDSVLLPPKKVVRSAFRRL